MRIYQSEDYQAMSRRAANIISAQVIYKPDCVLGLATGGTPVGTYKQLVEWYQKGDLSFSEVRSVNLDEYLGLSPHHEQSYRYFMQDNLFNHIDIKPENTHVLNGLAKNPEAECAAYNKLIQDLGGIDLQLLGMGHNGHIAFNEPGDDFGLEAHLVDLTESTIEANKRFFESRDEVPRHALSMGIKNIMNARRILIVVSGEEKADIVKQAFTGPVTKEVPASVLASHPRAFALEVEGDCMDRVIPEGSHVLVDPDREPGNGSIAVVETDSYQAVMRRWYRGSSTLMLTADSHSEQEDMVFGPEDGPVRVIGTVVWWQAPREME